LKENAYKARVAALSLVQMASVVSLLRAHGQTRHAEGVEAAKDAVIDIIGRQLGSDTLAHAMKCVEDEIGGDPQHYGAVTTQH
jgi:hypothetical protein